jgi:excisionase family DNA binding protein
VATTNDDSASPPRLYRLDQAADYLGVSVRTLHRMREAGEIGYLTVGTGTRRPRVRISQQHLDEYVLRAEHLASALPAARRR